MKIVSSNTMHSSRIIPACLLLAALMVPGGSQAEPVVSGNRINWTDQGWHQVQDQRDYQSICEDRSYCEVGPGVYIIINHTTGERFENIVVTGESTVDTYAVPATGQTISYVSGDDGEWQAGVASPSPRFSDNEDGTFTDRLTGLIWLAATECWSELHWQDAMDTVHALAGDGTMCASLFDGSKAGDWRLPNINELHSLVDVSENHPAWAQGMPFTNGWTNDPSSNYWSSTTFVIDSEFAWGLEFGIGRTQLLRKDSIAWAWPLRIQ